MTSALTVVRYTLLEQTRRMVLIALIAIAVLLIVAIGVAPLLIPGAPTGEDRNNVIVNAASSVVGIFTFVCAIAIGMTVIYNDLDGGGIVTILAKPISRLSYTIGKILAAMLMLILTVGAMAVTFLVILRLNGGGFEVVVAGYLAVQLAQVVLFAVLVMALTVIFNNTVAAIIGFVFSQVVNVVALLHTLVQNKVIHSSLWDPVINVVYWLVPHQLNSELPREIVRSALRRHPRPPGAGGRAFDPLSQIPNASGPADVAFWAAYLVVLCALLYLLVRRRQV